MENRNNEDVDVVLLWDTMTMQILSRSLKYAREKKKAKKKGRKRILTSLQESRRGSEYLEPFSVVDVFTKSKGCPR